MAKTRRISKRFKPFFKPRLGQLQRKVQEHILDGFDVPAIAQFLHRPRGEIMRTAKLLLQYSLGQKRLKRPLDSVVLSDPVCLNKYRPKISAEVIAFVKQRISKSKNPLQAKQVQAEIQAEKKVDLSLKSVRKILRSLGVSYKKIYRAEIRFNTVLAKQKQ